MAFRESISEFVPRQIKLIVIQVVSSSIVANSDSKFLGEHAQRVPFSLVCVDPFEEACAVFEIVQLEIYLYDPEHQVISSKLSCIGSLQAGML